MNELGILVKKRRRWSKEVVWTWEHLHPAALKGLGKPFDAALKKNMPHPSPIPLFKLQAPLTILVGERCSLLRPNSGFFLPSATCVKDTKNIPETFSIWREKKQTTVGECRGKFFGCKLGALQMAFWEPAFLRQGGDALMYFELMIFSVLMSRFPWILHIYFESFAFKKKIMSSFDLLLYPEVGKSMSNDVPTFSKVNLQSLA